MSAIALKHPALGVRASFSVGSTLFLPATHDRTMLAPGSDTDDRVCETDILSLTELLSVLGRVETELFTE